MIFASALLQLVVSLVILRIVRGHSDRIRILERRGDTANSRFEAVHDRLDSANCRIDAVIRGAK